MYASIRQYRLDAEEYRRVMPRIEAEFLPVLEQIEGFVNYRIWLDEAGQVVSASTFADPSRLPAVGRAGSRDVSRADGRDGD